MSGDSKFSSKRPKGDAWGVEDAVAKAAAEFRRTGKSPMIPFVGVMAVSKVEMSPGDDGPVFVAVVEIRRANSLDSKEAITAGQRLILKAIKDQEGGQGVEALPFDEMKVIQDAFGGVNVKEIELDDQELAKDQTLTDPDRLRLHLSKLHGFDPEEVDRMEMHDVQRTHQSLHENLPPTTMPHDVEWWAWRDIVVRERRAELRAEGVTWEDPAGPGEETPGGDQEGALTPEQEAQIPEMDDQQELRQHLVGVHDFSPELVNEEDLADLRTRHVKDHEEGDPEHPFPEHPIAWLGIDVETLDSGTSATEDDDTPADAKPAADTEQD